MHILTGALTTARLLIGFVATSFLLFCIILFGYDVLFFPAAILSPSHGENYKVINFLSISIGGSIGLFITAMCLARASQPGQAAGFPGLSSDFWRRSWFVFWAAFAALVLITLLLVLLQYVAVNLRLRWATALYAVVVAVALCLTGGSLRYRINAFARLRRHLFRPNGGEAPRFPCAASRPSRALKLNIPQTGRTGSLQAAVNFCAATSRWLEKALLQLGSHVAIRLEYLVRAPRNRRSHRWRDGLSVAVLAALKIYLLIRFGIESWHDNDGVGYVQLAAQLRRLSTWVSVPDLATSVTPLSLLRLPGYPLLILLIQTAAGDLWIPALVGVQLTVSLFATFLLYRTLWRFSGIWFFALVASAWFASSSVAYFERMILSDSLTISLFTILICGIGMVAFRQQRVGSVALGSIAVALPALFLLREANLIYAAALAPLLWLALAQEHRLRRLAIVYAPLVGVLVLIGCWQQYRTGYFLITTGGQVNPIEALALVDKISPVLDQDSPVDRAIRSITADQTVADIAQNSCSLVLEVNRRLAADLKHNAPQLARLLMARYLSVWQAHPHEMLAYMGRNQSVIRTVGVSPFVVNDLRLSEQIRGIYSYLSQKVVEWGLMALPLFWFGMVVAVAPLRRTGSLAITLSLAAIIPVAFYSAMFLETRYVLPALAPIVLVVALSIGIARPTLNRTRDGLRKDVLLTRIPRMTGEAEKGV
jgi:hypothetical protein